LTSYLDAPVFICGHRKGGTTVTVSLFDGHPELLTLPIDSGFFYAVFPEKIALGKDQTIEAIVEKTLEGNLREELTKIDAADHIDTSAIARRYTELASAGEHRPALHLKALMRAYGENCGQVPDNWGHWVEKTTSTEIYAMEIAEWFPKAQFLHIVRDPRDNWASLRSGWEKRYQHQESAIGDLIQTLLARAGLGLRISQLNVQALGQDKYRVERFEDMTRHPRESFEDICRFLRIDYHPALERPTIAGKLWPGNNFEGLAFSSLDDTNTGRWSERVPENEAALIEAHLGDIMETLGYNPTFSPRERALAASDHYKWINANRHF